MPCTRRTEATTAITGTSKAVCCGPRIYARVYFPRSIVFCAICCRSSMVLNGSCFAQPAQDRDLSA